MRRLAVLLLLLIGCSEPPAAPPDGGWNVLVLVPDTVRGDHVSAAGYPKPTTPAIDALAREGVLFTQALTAAPRTWQSFATILSGVYPPRHGVRYILHRAMDANIPTLATLLRDRGYETVGFDPLLMLREIAGPTGFERYAGSPKGFDGPLMERLTEFVLAEHDRPFLAFVRLNGAHWPYTFGTKAYIEEFGDPCSEHSHDFNVGSLGIVTWSRGKGVEVKDEAAFRKLIWTDDADEATHRHRIAHYDAEVRVVDARIAELVDAMRESGLLERTIVLVTSDHGESFFEHGYMQHGPRVDDPVMHVPLVMRLPRGHPEHRAGLRVDAQVRTVDILPTLLEAVGVAPPTGIDGVSLLPLLRDEPLPPLVAYGETGRAFMGIDPERHLPGVRGKHRMIRSEGWKLVYVPDEAGATFRLFDLRRDPGEQQDVAAAHPERVAELRAHLDAILAAEAPEGPERALTDAEFERLRQLGYVQ